MKVDCIPYTYRVLCTPVGKYYYGVRYAKGCSPDDLWKTYFTSSKKVKHLIELYGKENFIIEIRKVFTDIDSARNWEKRVNLHTKDWENYLNEFAGTSPSREVCRRSLESRRQSKKGLHGCTTEQLSSYGKKSLKLRTGIHSQTRDERLALSALGGKTAKELKRGIHSHSSEIKKLNGSLGGSSTKGLRWWNNGLIDTKAKECPGQNWIPGRLWRKQ